MREDTTAWLEPMMTAANDTFPAGWMLDLSAQVEGARQQAIDWDGWYPDHPGEPDTGNRSQAAFHVQRPERMF